MAEKSTSIHIHIEADKGSTVVYLTDKSTGRGTVVKALKICSWEAQTKGRLLLKKKGKEREYNRPLQTSRGCYMKRTERVFLN